MTTEPDNPERDPKLSAAWREHSAEMPPAELDAAILAAAHRAVGSAPLGSAQRAAHGQSLHATRPQRWWMPLAAAATIGAVALGILQTVPEDSPVTAPAVSDMPAATSPPASAPRDKLALQERKDMPRAEAESAPQQAGSSGAPPASVPAEPAEKVLAHQGANHISPMTPPPAAAPMNRSATSPASVPAESAEKVLAQRGADSLRNSATPAAAAPQPFPAEPKRDSDESGRANDRASRTLAAPPSSPPTSEFQRRKETAVDAVAEAPALARSPPPAAAPAPERMAAASDDKRQRNEVAQSAPMASGAVLAKKAASAEPDAAMSDSKTRDSAVREAAKQIDVDAWILRIRKLHDDGKLADAAKELVALRATIPDADRRLPPELRAWAATVKP